MNTIYTPLAFFVAVTGVGACVEAELAGTTGGAPERVCLIVPGAIAADDCQCGQLAVTVGRLYGSQTFPSEAQEIGDQPTCGLPYTVADITVQILRCVPGPDNQGNPPSCDDLAAAARVMHEDAYAVRRGVTCCLRSMRDAGQIEEWQVGATTFVGPEGGCAGSELAARIALTGLCCEE